MTLAGWACAGSFTWAPDSARRTQIELYLDPYYSALNYAHPLGSDSLRTYDADSERLIYLDLLKALPFPHDALIEVSAYPVPLAGVGVRRELPEPYRRVTLNGAPLVQMVTEDYPDPWAVSLFLGNVARLVSSKDSGKVEGLGYSGLLVTAGNRQLVANRLIPDDWIEVEAKLKGEDIRTTRKLGWSFRTGLRVHDNPELRQTAYLAFRRTRTDFQESSLGWLRNSSAEFRLDLDRKDLSLLRYQLVVGKKVPFASGRFAAALDLGVIRQIHPLVRGSLVADQTAHWRFVIHPNLEF